MDDSPGIFQLRSDGEINKYLDRPASKTIEDAIDFITRVNENINNKNSLYWTITLGDKNNLVGTICLFSFSDESGTCEIGYELLPAFQGKGVMKEAAEKVIDFAFNNIQVKKIEAIVHRNNQRSINLLEKIFFRNTGKTNDANPELVCYCLTNTDGCSGKVDGQL
jgi:ribosomal-protein-alanine N-acetyltransferase